MKRIHLVGVAGTGMGAFAGMLKAAGYEVTGSDENVYPPMSDMLREWRVEVFTPYAAENLDRAKPDLVIIGNVIREVNPEATAVRDRNVPQQSFPAAFGELIIGKKHGVVITGTHGKTTVSAMMGHVLADAGLDPTFLVGGVTLNNGSNFRLGKGDHVVVEGDEYDTAYFDKGPKFLHYRARTALLTSIEFDHADIYRDIAHYESAYERFCQTLPEDGWLGVSAAYPRAVAIARANTAAHVVTYGVAREAREARDTDYLATDITTSPDGLRFSISGPTSQVSGPRSMVQGPWSKVQGPRSMVHGLLLPMSGRHNVENAVGVFAAARALGVSDDAIVKAFANFRGVKRRQEPRGEPGGVLVIDDFAHHPTAVRETIAGIRERYAGRRLWAVFEPRSNTSRRNTYQAEYESAFDGADVVTIRVPEPHDKVPADQQLDVHAIVRKLEGRGVRAAAIADVDAIARLITGDARPGDVILVMSNGSFGGLIPSVLESIGGRFRRSTGNSPA